MTTNYKHVYLVKVMKTDYYYVPVKADNADQAEDIVIDALDDVFDLEDYYDDSGCEVVCQEGYKTALEGVKTIN